MARVHKAMITALDDTDVASIIWMPAHTAEHEIGKAKKSNVQPITATDRWANGQADILAKKAVEEHRVPTHIREAVDKRMAYARRVAATIGRCNSAACELRDSTVSKKEAKVGRATRGNRDRRVTRRHLHPDQGGHEIARIGTMWKCMQCFRRRESWTKGKLDEGAVVRRDDSNTCNDLFKCILWLSL